MSITKSSSRPRGQYTYLAWPGGTSAKWMPRMVPRRETLWLACATVSGWPTVLLNTGS